MGIMFITHDLGVITLDKVVVMYKGDIVEQEMFGTSLPINTLTKDC